MDPISLIAGLVAGGGLGFIGGAWFSSRRWLGYLEHAIELATAADEQLIRKQGRELAELRAERQKRLAPLVARNARVAEEARARKGV